MYMCIKFELIIITFLFLDIKANVKMMPDRQMYIH